MRTGDSPPHSVSPEASVIRAEYPTPCDAGAAGVVLANAPQQDCAGYRTARPGDLANYRFDVIQGSGVHRDLLHVARQPGTHRHQNNRLRAGDAQLLDDCGRQGPRITENQPRTRRHSNGRRKRSVPCPGRYRRMYRSWSADDANTWHGGRSTRRCGLHDISLALERIGRQRNTTRESEPFARASHDTGTPDSQRRPTASNMAFRIAIGPTWMRQRCRDMLCALAAKIGARKSAQRITRTNLEEEQSVILGQRSNCRFELHRTPQMRSVVVQATSLAPP